MCKYFWSERDSECEACKDCAEENTVCSISTTEIANKCACKADNGASCGEAPTIPMIRPRIIFDSETDFQP